LSYAHIKAGRWAEAAEAAHAAVRLDPTNTTAWANFGRRALQAGGRRGRADRHWSEASRSIPRTTNCDRCSHECHRLGDRSAPT
jgi:predicted Zn-dependent protease